MIGNPYSWVIFSFPWNFEDTVSLSSDFDTLTVEMLKTWLIFLLLGDIFGVIVYRILSLSLKFNSFTSGYLEPLLNVLPFVKQMLWRVHLC